MPAVCASCLRPIVGRDSFVIAGTEVVHRACAAAGMAATELSRARQTIEDLTARLRRALVLAEEQTVAKLVALQDARTARRELQERMAGAADQQAVMNARITALTRRAEIAEEALADAQLERDLNQADTTVAVATTPTPAVAPESKPKAEPADDAAVRFALLELD